MIEDLQLFLSEFPFALWETFYSTLLATLFAVIIGLPLGVLLVVSREDGIMPLNKSLMKLIDLLINILRSVPFLILMVVVIPFTRLLIGTAVGTFASIVPLVIASFPFIARLTETSLLEVDNDIIEMA